MNVIGLMSGTSLDGIDAALVQIEMRGDVLNLTLQAFVMHPLDNALREAVRALLPPHQGSTRAVCQLNFALGEVFAQAAKNVAQTAHISLENIDFIASHGQTVYHQADFSQPNMSRSTLQIANPAVIAARTGCTVVSDFRSRDIALGGHGAPLVPWFDGLLFRHQNLHRVALNIGGMANLSYVPPAVSSQGEILAFDTGPGNVLIDEAMRIITHGEKSFDEGGNFARSGAIHENLLQKWLAHPYFQLAPPKSTGRELFGPREAQNMLSEGRNSGLNDAAILATLTALTARTITNSLKNLPRVDELFVDELFVDELFVGGGGAQNAFLMGQIKQHFSGVVRHTDELGLPADAKEAVAFATMGFATLHHWPANVPSATGAAHGAVLGSLTPGDNFVVLMQKVAQKQSSPPTRLILRESS